MYNLRVEASRETKKDLYNKHSELANWWPPTIDEQYYYGVVSQTHAAATVHVSIIYGTHRKIEAVNCKARFFHLSLAHYLYINNDNKVRIRRSIIIKAIIDESIYKMKVISYTQNHK